DRRDDAEETVPPDGQTKSIDVLFATAADHPAMTVDEHEGLHIRDDGPHRQTASVYVRGERATDGQSVGTGLLLRDRPRAMINQIVDQLWPFDAGLHFDNSALSIEVKDVVHRADVDERRIGFELLSAH